MFQFERLFYQWAYHIEKEIGVFEITQNANVNNKTNYERELQQKVNVIRYRDFDISDLIELIVLSVRLENFNQVTKDLLYILKLKRYSDDLKNLL